MDGCISNFVSTDADSSNKKMHRDVDEGQLDAEAPMLSRLGLHTVMLWAAQRKLRLFTADVKSASLQADDV